MALTYVETVRVQAALEVCRQNWQTSALDGPAQSKEWVTSQPPRTFNLSLKSHCRIKEQENLGKSLKLGQDYGFKLEEESIFEPVSQMGSFPFLPHPCLVSYLGPCRRAGLQSACPREGSWGAAPVSFSVWNHQKVIYSAKQCEARK